MGTLFDELIKYAKTDYYPYHMPGHKRCDMPGFPGQILGLDITEIAGMDNLHEPEGILLEAQKRAAAAYGAEESFYLVNGSTSGILSAISAAVPFDGHLLIARNSHKSVYHAAYLRQLKLSYIYPEMMQAYDICEAVTPKQVELALEKDASIQAVLVVSPTYEGRIADMEAIARIVHKKGIPLIVDEAHGAHLGFGDGFAVNSCRQGADLVINSVHKTLPAMTQTALLHCNGTLIDRGLLRRYLHIYQSSSPSYIMMGSIDHAVQMAVEGEGAFGQFREYWLDMLQRLEALQNLKILPQATEAPQNLKILPQATEARQNLKILSQVSIPHLRCIKHDIGKLIISTKGTVLSGKRLAEMLREKYHLETEMACETYLLAMFTMADTREGYERLIHALLEIDRNLTEMTEASRYQKTGTERAETDESKMGKACTEKSETGSSETVKFENAKLWILNIPGETDGRSIPFYQAWDQQKRLIPLDRAEGCIAGEFINLYPPGSPIVVPGEVLDRKVVEQIKNCLKSGLDVQGIVNVAEEVQG